MGSGNRRGLVSTAWQALAALVTFPVRLLLLTKLMSTSMEQGPAFFSPDDPTEAGYRTPPLDLSQPAAPMFPQEFDLAASSSTVEAELAEPGTALAMNLLFRHDKAPEEINIWTIE
jgi:hypothetical protein